MTMDWSATMLDVAGVAAQRLNYPLDGVSMLGPSVAQCGAHSFPAPAVLAHEPPRPAGAARRRLEIPAAWTGNDYLFNLPADERERANLGRA
jgi:hypothetical protein